MFHLSRLLVKLLMIPRFSLVHDNTVFGYTAPVSEQDILLHFSAPQKWDGRIGFGSFLYDFRHYFKLGEDYSFVARWSGEQVSVLILKGFYRRSGKLDQQYL